MPKVTSQTINLSNLTLEEKVGQMIMINTNQGLSQKMIDLNIGGIFLNGNKTANEFQTIINQSQKKSKIKLLVATDMEGYWNPFSDFSSLSLGELKNEQETINLAKSHATQLKKAGFNLDFSPVVEHKNTVWPGRSFVGNDTQRKQMIQSYISTLQKNGVAATAKHYPGGSMEKNPHWRLVQASIDSNDLTNFKWAIEANVSAIMIGHAIVSGQINSKKKPATVSPEVITNLRNNFDGIIITDDINMLGLRLKYLFRRKQMCVDIVKAGNDIILDSWKTKERNVKKCINAIVKSVEKGEINEKQIDTSVIRILKQKGYEVIA